MYLASLGLSFVFLVAQMLGIDGDVELPSLDGGPELHLEMDGDVDADMDMDHDVDIDFHHDIDVEAGHDFDHAFDQDLDSDVRVPANVSGDGGSSLSVQILHFAGIGRIPLSLWAMAMCVTLGISGLGLNSFLSSFLPWPSVFFPISFAISLSLAFVVSGSAARIVGRYMPKSSSAGTSERDLEGSVGKLVYALKPGKIGTVRVSDRSGTMIQCSVFTETDEEIVSGGCVLLLGYDEKKKAFEVEIAPAELLSLPE